MLSVIVPAFNAGAYISATLASLTQDPIRDLEIVVCDDGSSDNTAAIASGHAHVDPRIKVVKQANAGAAAARNAGFLASKGRWIVYFDADDLLQAGSLGAAYSLARANPADSIYWSWAKFGTDPGRLQYGPRTLSGAMPGCQWLTCAFLRDYPTYPGCFMLPRPLLEAYGGWDERLSFQDDMEFYARVISRTGTMRYCPDALFCYRQGAANSLSKTGSRRSSESHWLATRLATEHLLRASDTPDARASAVRQMMLVSYTQVFAAPDISREAEQAAGRLASGLLWRPWLPGGPLRRVLQAMLGWRLALRVHAFLRSLLR